MKIFKNVLSDNTIKKLGEEFDLIRDKNVWYINELLWDSRLNEGSAGICAHAFVSNQLSKRVIEEIKHLLPACNEYVLQYYCWFKNSSIAPHTDDAKIFGCTIYLNEHWAPVYGGLFVYKNGSEDKVLIPEFNTMVLNDEMEHHLVTSVSPMAPTFRFTLQIWGM